MMLRFTTGYRLSEGQRRIFFWLMLALCYFGQNDTKKAAILLAVIYLMFHTDRLQFALRSIGKRQIYAFFILGLIWSAGLVYRAIFYEKIEGAAYLSERNLFYTFFTLFVMVFFSVVCCRDVREFCVAGATVMAIQSIIAVLSVFSPTVKQILNAYYSFRTTASFERYLISSTRGVGINLVGSRGAIALLTGQIMLVYLRLQRSITRRNFVIAYLLIVAGEVVVGRTGFYFSIFLLFAYLWMDRPTSSKYAAALQIVLLGTAGIVAFLLCIRQIYPDIYNRWVDWIFELFVDVSHGEKNRTLAAIQNTSYPPLTAETLWGTSIVKGVSRNGTFFQNDIGYMQSYFALGLVGAVIFYFSYLYLFLRPVIKRRLNFRKFFFVATLILFILEYKEPAIRYEHFAFTLLSLELFDACDGTARLGAERTMIKCSRSITGV